MPSEDTGEGEVAAPTGPSPLCSLSLGHHLLFSCLGAGAAPPGSQAHGRVHCGSPKPVPAGGLHPHVSSCPSLSLPVALFRTRSGSCPRGLGGGRKYWQLSVVGFILIQAGLGARRWPSRECVITALVLWWGPALPPLDAHGLCARCPLSAGQGRGALPGGGWQKISCQRRSGGLFRETRQLRSSRSRGLASAVPPGSVPVLSQLPPPLHGLLLCDGRPPQVICLLCVWSCRCCVCPAFLL